VDDLGVSMMYVNKGTHTRVYTHFIHTVY